MNHPAQMGMAARTPLLPQLVVAQERDPLQILTLGLRAVPLRPVWDVKRCAWHALSLAPALTAGIGGNADSASGSPQSLYWRQIEDSPAGVNDSRYTGSPARAWYTQMRLCDPRV